MIKTVVPVKQDETMVNVHSISAEEFQKDLPSYVPSEQVAKLIEALIRTDLGRELANRCEGITDEHMKQIYSWKYSEQQSSTKLKALKLFKIYKVIKAIDESIDFKVRLNDNDFEIWALLNKKDKKLFEKISDAICDYEIKNKEFVSLVIIAYDEISSLKGLDFIIEL